MGLLPLVYPILLHFFREKKQVPMWWWDTHRQNRPRKKKAYVRLTQDYDALDVANRIGFPAAISEMADDFPTFSLHGWLIDT